MGIDFLLRTISLTFATPQGMLGNMVSPAMTPQTNASAMSAPGAFQQTGHMAPMDMFSPLTSPALGPSIGVAPNQRLYTGQEWSASMSNLAPHNTSPQRMDGMLPADQQHQQHSLMRTGGTPNKRPVPEEANAPPARKRQSPLVKPTVPQTVAISRKTRARKADLHQGSYNTPSPIDMDASLMPPPAPPAGPEPDPNRSSSSNNTSPDIEPVTPASIMNMGHSARLPTGLVPGAELPLGPMTAQQQQLAESLTRDGGLHHEQPVDVAASKKGKAVGGSATSATKAKGGAANGGNRSTKPSPVIRAASSGSTTPKTILPSGETP